MKNNYQNSIYHKFEDADDWWMEEQFGNTNPDDPSQYVFFIGCEDELAELLNDMKELNNL